MSQKKIKNAKFQFLNGQVKQLDDEIFKTKYSCPLNFLRNNRFIDYLIMDGGASGLETFKIIILGPGGVGKSALTIQLVQGRFSAAYDPTIEDSYKKVIVVDGKEYNLDILDTAGQDNFASIRDTYMRVGQGFLIVFAVNDPSSFDNVDKFYRDIKLANEKENVPIVVCGNKCDLPDRQVTKEEAENLCNNFKVKYIETSAKNNINVMESFVQLTQLILAQKPSSNPTPKADEKNEDPNQGKGGCCETI